MATIVLQAAGAAIGSIFGPVGAAIGRAAGALAGSAIDQALFADNRARAGTHLSTGRLAGADEGQAILSVYGTARIAGTLIWATRFEEEALVERSGGKAGGSSTESFRYYANLAIGLCEGEIALVRRVFADGRPLDLTRLEMRVYRGTAEQMPDPLIAARQGGADRTPAYRGLAYVVFERLPLDVFGNRIPFLTFEVVRPVGRLEKMIRAVTVIPGATEHGYRTEPVRMATGPGAAVLMNRHTLSAETDFTASMDELTALCPKLEAVALTVSWFGTDLRAGACRLEPGVEAAARDESAAWRVAGRSRASARLVSRTAAGPAYGGTPDDAAVLSAIRDLKGRGLKVFLYPLILMDIPAGNGLPDPYGGAEQGAYPWRGRITVHPAPGQAGSVDRSDEARRQIDSFSTAYRAMMTHFVSLAGQAGGVAGLVIGSEMRGLTGVRDKVGAFPFVETLMAVAAEAKAALGAGTALTYAADWSEYGGLQPPGGGGDIAYPLDPLWASDAIDAIGIDNYLPLSDWRDEDRAAGNPDGLTTPEDRAGLRRAITSGEGFDWYYASSLDRAARRRTPIRDGIAGKDWVYRVKDIAGWWANRHVPRSGGREATEATGFKPKGKPVWLTELGCPAVDKGAAQPNMFPDAKSAEGGLPYFSTGARSDGGQRAFLEAHLMHWEAVPAAERMVDPARVFLWTWDARPYPAFPLDGATWSDGANWRSGHWLNGRLGTATLADTLAAILAEHGFDDVDVSAVEGDLGGYVKGAVGSARDLIEPLMAVFGLDAVEEGGRLRFLSQSRAMAATRIELLAEEKDGPLWREERRHEGEVAGEARLGFADMALDHAEANVRARRAGGTARVIRHDLPAAMAKETAEAAVHALLRRHRVARRSLGFSLPPTALAPQPGDAVTLAEGPEGRFVISRIEDGAVRRVEAIETLSAASGAGRTPEDALPVAPGTASADFAPEVVLMDLPAECLPGGGGGPAVAAYAKPFRTMTVLVSASREAYRRIAVIDRPARIGRLTEPLAPGVPGRFDRAARLVVELGFGAFASLPRDNVLAGDNRVAVIGPDGVLEVIGFLEAAELAPGRFRLSGLLRGLAGTEEGMRAGAVAGARIVALDAAVAGLALSTAETGLALSVIAEASGTNGGRAGPFAFAGGLRQETPLSPVHLSAARRADGGTSLGWVRRARRDADRLDGPEIGLDEPAEAYQVEILSAEGRVLRRVETATAALVYPRAAELGDFGAVQRQLRLRIRQTGARVYEGQPLEAVVAI